MNLAYGQPQKKKPTVGDKEDQAFVQGKSGVSITSYEEWLPDKEGERNN
jgi:hypothetical protein